MKKIMLKIITGEQQGLFQRKVSIFPAFPAHNSGPLTTRVELHVLYKRSWSGHSFRVDRLIFSLTM